MSGRYFLIIDLLTPSSFINALDWSKYSWSSFSSVSSDSMSLSLVLYSSNLSFSTVRFSSLSVMLWISFSRSFLSFVVVDKCMLCWEISLLMVVISFWKPRNLAYLCSSALTASSSSSTFALYLAMSSSSLPILSSRKDSSIDCVHLGQTVLLFQNPSSPQASCLLKFTLSLNLSNFFTVSPDPIYSAIAFSFSPTPVMRVSTRSW